MVFFTCNNCGDSLKKKDCANHAGKCHPLALTCVDCHKDFFGNEFVAHTSCVTEAEKYGVKGFVSRAPSTTGVAKQEEWTRAVLSASEASGLTSSQKYFLGILTRHGNVPRKKKPFTNFARSVWRDSARQVEVVDQVFGMLESEFQKIKGPAKESDTSKTTDESNDEVKDKAINNAAESEVENTTSKKPKGKKAKAIDELKVIANGGQEKMDKKSKKKSQKEACDGVIELKGNETELIPANPVNDAISKKSKKKKHKKQDAQSEADATLTENGNGAGEESVNAEDNSSGTKSKKKKSKRKETRVEEEVTNNGNGIADESVNVEDDFTSTSKKSKSKKKLAEVDESGLVELVAEDLPKKSNKKKHKKKEENGTEITEIVDGQKETPVDAAKDTIKKSKKKKHKLQEAEEDVPRKKSKSTSG